MNTEKENTSPRTATRQVGSEFLRSQCSEILRRLFPDSGKIGDCTPTDLIMLLTIFHLSRNASLSQAPRLLSQTICFATQQLITHPPYHHYNNQYAFVDMRRYLSLLAEALRSFREDVDALRHDIRNQWYDCVTNLYEISDRARRTCPRQYQIELWDVMFFLKHCQYLVISMKDSYSTGDMLFEFGSSVVKGVALGYGGQYVEAMDFLKAFTSRKRNRENWHQTYLELEHMCFNALARDVQAHNETAPSVDWDELEHQITIALKDTLDYELLNDSGSIPGRIMKGLRTFGGMFGEKFMSSGQYEDNNHYFTYGLLDLMYYLAFRVKNRESCFEEIVAAIQIVLQRSHPSASLLHRKAIDLYHKINEVGLTDNTEYGKVEERQIIECWMTEHAKQIECWEDSKRRLERTSREIQEQTSNEILLQSQRKYLEEQTQHLSTEVNPIGVQPTLPPTQPILATEVIPNVPQTQSTLSSEIFPHVPQTRSTLRSEIFPHEPQTQSTLASEIFPHVPQIQSSLDSENLSVTLQQSTLESEILHVHNLSGRFQGRSRPQIAFDPQPARILVPPLVSSPGPIDTSSRTSSNDYLSHRGSQVSEMSSSRQLTMTPSPQGSDNSSRIPNTISDDLPTEPDPLAPLAPQPSVSQSFADSSHGASSTDHIAVRISSASGTTPFGPEDYEEFEAFLEWRRFRTSQSDQNVSTTRRSTDRLELPTSHYAESISTNSISSWQRTSLNRLQRTRPDQSANRRIPTSIFVRVELHRLHDLATKQIIPETVKLKAISAAGDMVAVLSSRKFWVYATNPQVSIVCTGHFTNNGKLFQRALNNDELKPQYPIPDYKLSRILCAALSSTYLAVGCPGGIITFIITGEQAGRWVTLKEFEDKDAVVEKLTFSGDGSQLFAYVRLESGGSIQSKALIFSSEDFPRDRIERMKPIKPNAVEVVLRDWESYRPNGVAFSGDGTTIALCTSYLQSTARIQLLKKTESTWDLWGEFHTVKVFPAHDPRDWHGHGLTGISFYQNDQYLAISMDSSYINAADCFGISSSEDGKSCKLKPYKRIFAPGGTTNLAIAVSHPFGAVVLLGDDGRLQLKRSGTGRQELPILERRSTRPAAHEYLGEFSVISFSRDGKRLLVLDKYAELEIYDFDEETLRNTS